MSERASFKNYLDRAELDSKTHQFEGVEWCMDREQNGRPAGPSTICRGGLIADEMGLGKTIEILGTMASNPVRRTLIVVPLPLLAQWNTAATRGKVFEPLIYHGPAKRKLTSEDVSAASVVLTTYDTLASKTSKCLHEIRWNRLICDEAHRLRNRRTRAHAAIIQLNAEIRWLVTGTPIQNRKADFYSLCAAMGLPESYFKKQENLGKLAKSFILRRTKKDVGIQLPSLAEYRVGVEWQSEDEARFAEDIHSLLQFSGVAGRKGVRPKLGSTSAKLFGSTTLPLLVRARQACVYPPLMKLHLNKMVEEGVIESSDWLMNAVQTSSKVDAVVKKLIERRSETDRKIVFCNYRGEIDAVIQKLEQAGISTGSLDGRTSKEDRTALLEGKRTVEVLVLQIQTGCEGLNLQDFNEVFFVSPHWNPAVEDQAVARCHRIGQEKSVHVFRFQMMGFDADTRTVEAYSRAVQMQKRKLVEEIREAATTETTEEKG